MTHFVEYSAYGYGQFVTMVVEDCQFCLGCQRHNMFDDAGKV